MNDLCSIRAPSSAAEFVFQGAPSNCSTQGLLCSPCAPSQKMPALCAQGALQMGDEALQVGIRIFGVLLEPAAPQFESHFVKCWNYLVS